MDLFEKCHNYTRAREVQATGFYPYFIPITRGNGTEVELNGQSVVMIGSNNYLGLTHHEHVIGAAREAIETHGTSCTGSRFLNGTLDLHEELERRLAVFLDRDAALCFSTGFQTNLGVISALCGREDKIFCDRENHASIVDGCRLTFSEVRKFRHNNAEQLAYLLERCDEAGDEGGNGGKLVIVDGAFSMMGDLADLPAITPITTKHGARLIVDEAHSVGVMGEHGRGAAEHFGVEDRVDLVVGTFSKSFASLGGFVAGPDAVIHYIKHHARSLIFSASIPPSAAAAALAALDILEAEPERRRKVLANAEFMQRELTELGFQIGPTETPIVPVVVGDQELTFRFWKSLLDHGVFTNPVTAPAVPQGMDLIRTSFMATHTPEQLDRVLDVFKTVGDKLDLRHRDPIPSVPPPAASDGQREAAG